MADRYLSIVCERVEGNQLVSLNWMTRSIKKSASPFLVLMIGQPQIDDVSSIMRGNAGYSNLEE
jgi:hypothetical protein